MQKLVSFQKVHLGNNTYTLETNKHHLGLNKLQGVPFGRLPAQLHTFVPFYPECMHGVLYFEVKTWTFFMRFNI